MIRDERKAMLVVLRQRDQVSILRMSLAHMLRGVCVRVCRLVEKGGKGRGWPLPDSGSLNRAGNNRISMVAWQISYDKTMY